MQEEKKERKKVVKTPRVQLSLLERVERLEKHRFGEKKPYA